MKNIALIYKGRKKTVVTLKDGDEIRERFFDPTVEDVLYVSRENADRLTQEQPDLWELQDKAEEPQAHAGSEKESGKGKGKPDKEKAGDK